MPLILVGLLLLLAALALAAWWAARGRPVPPTSSAPGDPAGEDLAREVARRRAAEAEVRRLNADLEGLFAVIPIGIGIALDPDCRDIRSNRELARMLQLPLGQNASKTGPGAGELAFRIERYNGEEIPGEDLVMQRAVRTGEPVLNDSYRIVHPDGEAMDVLGSAAPLFDGDGRIRGAVGAFIDVTERRRIEEQLHQARRMQAVGQLAGGVAHDINNAMTTVLGFAEFAGLRLSPDHPAAGDLSEIRRGAERATEIARQLLTFSRRQGSEPQPWRLATVVGELEPTLARVAGAAVTLTIRCAPEPTPVRVDRGQLEQVLINLAANAADAMPEGGSLVVETDTVEVPHRGGDADVAPGEYAVITVRDTGRGMDADTRRRAFEPFFTTRRAAEGTGLGLAIVYGIVTQAGGTVRLDSAPGLGTTVTVLLPLIPVEALGQEVEAEEIDRSGAGRRVLVVEDDPSVRRLAVDTLQHQGFLVDSAADGREAISLLEASTEPPDLVITDLVLPHLSGRTVRQAVETRYPGVPVLYISGYPGEAIESRGWLDEGVPFLQKPFSPRELVRRSRELLEPRPELRS
ncbi:MAG TPA: ATP-binding protein [Gemmatimonadales bacterium]|nr:ATP-binding protein [Gemmatimonadales bacterium]